MEDVFEMILAPLISFAGTVALALYERAGHKDKMLGSYLPWLLLTVIILAVCLLAVILFWDSSWWLLMASALPLLYVPYRKYGLHAYRKEIAAAVGDVAVQDARYGYLRHLDTLKLTPREVEKEYLPNMLVLFEIGAHKMLKEKLDELEAYSSCYHHKLYRAYLAYAANDFKTFLEKIKGIKEDKITETERQRLIINKICAYNNLELKEDVKSQMELLKKRLESDGQLFVEGYENLAVYFEQTSDEESLRWLFDIIRNKKPKSFGRYLQQMDIIFHYNRDRGIVLANELLIGEIFRALPEYRLSDADKLRLEISMLAVYFENGSYWMRHARNLFDDIDMYMNHSLEVAFTYMQTVTNVFQRAASTSGDYQIQMIMKMFDEKMESRLSGYIPLLDSKIADTKDIFLYRKREMLRWKIQYYYMLMRIRNDYSETEPLVRTLKNIILLSELNGETRETLHSKVVFIDEVLVITEHMKANNAHNLLRNYVEEAKEMLKRMDDDLENAGFNPSCAYYIMYSAHFHMVFGEEDVARIRYHQFVRSGATAKHFTRPVQQIFQRLQAHFTPDTPRP